MATDYNLEITQGSDYSIRLNLKESDGSLVNLSGYSVSGFVKHRYSDTGVILDLLPSIAGDGTSGVVDISLNAAQTSVLPIMEGIYDVEKYNSDYTSISKVLKGKVLVYPEVTY